MRFLRISIVTGIERHEALDLVRVVLGRCDGWIVSHTFFSNLSATINFEMPIDRAKVFVEQLEDTGFRTNVADAAPMAGEGDLRGQLTLSFVHKDPDLRRDVPAF